MGYKQVSKLMKKKQLAFRLEELITKKYGADRLEFACSIISQWLSLTCPNPPSPKRVLVWTRWPKSKICKCPFRECIEEALRQLFGLQTIHELYNQ